jgi:hypothetical protein
MDREVKISVFQFKIWENIFLSLPLMPMDGKIEVYKAVMCENTVLRRIFGSKKQETTEGWRKLHSEENRIFILRQK